MVPALSMFAAGCGLVFCFGVPLALVILLAAKGKAPFVPLLAGAAVYGVWQLLFSVIAPALAGLDFFQGRYWLYALAAGLLAGVLLEGGRAAALRILRKRREWTDAVALGLGIGGLDAIFSTGTYLLNYLYYANLANSGRLEAFLVENGMAGSAYPELLAAIADRGAASLLLSGFRQLFLLLLQLALTLFILGAVRRRKPWILPAAVASHFLTDSLVGLLQVEWGLPAWAPCLLLALLTLAAGAVLLRWKPWREKAAPGSAAEPA